LFIIVQALSKGHAVEELTPICEVVS